MQQTNEIKASLKREYVLYSNAVAFYKKALQEFEQKHQLSTQTFLKRFEAGQMGDKADYFDWYAFARLLAGGGKHNLQFVQQSSDTKIR